MPRELSSRITPLYRWIIPTILSIGAILIVWKFARVGMPGRPDPTSLLLAIAAAAAMIYIARIFDRAKRVWIDGSTLIVSDYRKQMEIDLTEIESVETSRHMKPDRIRLRFKRPTKFGDSIVFFPPCRWLDFSSAHPFATELEQMTDEES